MIDKDALIQPDKGQPATTIHLVSKAGLEGFVKALSGPQRAALSAQKFSGAANEQAVVPDGEAWLVAAGVADPDALSTWCLAKLGESLPAGTYRLANGDAGKALLGWVTGQYSFDRYRAEPSEEGPRVLLTKAVKAIEQALAEAAAVALVRDLVNTPGPARTRGPGHRQGPRR
jgi:leucyl aminopeptidase